MSISALLFTLTCFGSDNNQVIPYTLADRDRATRMEAKIDALNQRIDALDKRIDETNKRIDETNRRIDETNRRIDETNRRIDEKADELKTFLYWGFGILFSMMMFLFGFVLWDRRTTLSPVRAETNRLGEKGNILEKVLREYAAKHSDLASILKSHGLL